MPYFWQSRFFKNENWLLHLNSHNSYFLQLSSNFYCIYVKWALIERVNQKKRITVKLISVWVLDDEFAIYHFWEMPDVTILSFRRTSSGLSKMCHIRVVRARRVRETINECVTFPTFPDFDDVDGVLRAPTQNKNNIKISTQFLLAHHSPLSLNLTQLSAPLHSTSFLSLTAERNLIRCHIIYYDILLLTFGVALHFLRPRALNWEYQKFYYIDRHNTYREICCLPRIFGRQNANSAHPMSIWCEHI